MKPLARENIIVAFLDRLIKEYGFSYVHTKFNYICEHEFYSSLNLRNEYNEARVNLTIIANDILDEICFCVNYDLRSDGTYWKGKQFKYKLSEMDLITVENFIKEL